MSETIAAAESGGSSAPLKSCPFCGAEAAIKRFPSNSIDRCWQVDCTNPECKCSVSTCALRTKEEAVTAWNTRAEPQPDITGPMWSAGRSAFIKYAGQFELAGTHESASVIADVAPAEIYKAMAQHGNSELTGIDVGERDGDDGEVMRAFDYLTQNIVGINSETCLTRVAYRTVRAALRARKESAQGGAP